MKRICKICGKIIKEKQNESICYPAELEFEPVHLTCFTSRSLNNNKEIKDYAKTITKKQNNQT